MGFNFGLFNAMFIIVPIMVVGGFVFTFAMIFSPRLRAHFMSKQVKAANYVVEDNKEELKNISDTSAYISEEAITRSAAALKRGLSDSPSGYASSSDIYCSFCGSPIDADSVFCKKCGKKQRKTKDDVL